VRTQLKIGLASSVRFGSAFFRISLSFQRWMDFNKFAVMSDCKSLGVWEFTAYNNSANSSGVKYFSVSLLTVLK
jgi:hypothetical protein